MEMVISTVYGGARASDRRIYKVDLSRLLEDVCFEVWADAGVQASGSIIALTSGLNALKYEDERLHVTTAEIAYVTYGASEEHLRSERDPQVAELLSSFLREDIEIKYAQSA